MLSWVPLPSTERYVWTCFLKKLRRLFKGRTGLADTAFNNNSLRNNVVFFVQAIPATQLKSGSFVMSRKINKIEGRQSSLKNGYDHLSHTDLCSFVEIPIVAQKQDRPQKRMTIRITAIGRTISVAVLLNKEELLTPFGLREGRAGKATPFLYLLSQVRRSGIKLREAFMNAQPWASTFQYCLAGPRPRGVNSERVRREP